MFLRKISLAAAMLALPASVACAASIQFSSFSPSRYADAVAVGSFVSDSFEDEGAAMGEGEVGTGFATSVGIFDSAGGRGTGGTVRGLSGNTGTQLALRDGNTYGRRDVTGGDWVLDSNDTFGITWQVSTGSMFNRIVFVLTDGSDAGGFLRVTAGGTSAEQRPGRRLRNGNAQIVTIDFDDLVSEAAVSLINYRGNGTAMRRNDGFAIDAVQVGVAPVPVPAAGVLLLAGLGGFAAMRRFSRKS